MATNDMGIDPKYLALIQAGMGILAGNNGRQPTGAAIGQGLLGGVNGYQDALQQQQLQAMRQQQMDMQGKQFGLQEKTYTQNQAKFDRETEDYNKNQSAIDEASKLHPELAPLFILDPKAAIKAIYPNASGADAYYQFLPTPDGYVAGNARTGKVEEVLLPNGQRVVKSSDSPRLQGDIEGSKSRAKAMWKPNTDIDGQVLTDAQVAQMARGGGIPSYQGNTPYPMTWNGQPMGAPNTTRTDAIEGDGNIALRNPSRPNIGIQVPTKAEQAAAVEQAKSNVSLGNEKVKNVRKADQFLSVAQQAGEILNNDTNKPTHSGIGALIDSASSAVGYAPDGASEASRLEALSGWLVSNVPRMEGPQSNFDVDNYKTMSGMVGDRTKPLKVRQEALKEVVRLQEKYKSLNQDGEQQPSVESPKKPNQQKSKSFKIDGGKSVLGVLGADGNYYTTVNGKKYRVEE